MDFGVKVANDFRILFQWKDMNFCVMTSQLNSMKSRYAKAMMKAIMKMLPKALFTCPLDGIIEFVNIRPNDGFYSVIPEGIYRAIVCINDLQYKSKVILLFEGIIEK